MNDLHLWQRLKVGDKKALEEIYRSEVTTLLRYGHKFSADQTLVEDCIHDLFIEIWSKRQQLGNTDSIRKYLIVSLRRKIIRNLKRLSRTQLNETLEEPAFASEAAVDLKLIETEISEERLSELRKMIDSLPSRQKEVLYLKYQMDLDYEQIAEIMQINYQSVRNLNHKAIAMLRKGLSLWILLQVLCREI